MEAEFASVCDYCDDDIEVGDTIVKDNSYGWVHVECGEEIADEESDWNKLRNE